MPTVAEKVNRKFMSTVDKNLAKVSFKIVSNTISRT